MTNVTNPVAPPEARASDWPAEQAVLLGRVTEVLERDGPQAALDHLNRSRDASAWIANAQAVCLLRLGQHQRALELLRGLALGGIGGLKADAPTVFKTNYATAQLLTGNMTGCVVSLGQTRDEDHLAVRRLRAALRDWRRSLSFWDRARDFLGGEVGRPVELGFPPGDL